MNAKPTRQAAGPGGPRCLRRRRDDEILKSTTAIRRACDKLIAEGIRPSIATVVTRSGCSRSTVNRERYRSMLRAGRACFDLMSTGMSHDDARALVGDSLSANAEAALKGADERADENIDEADVEVDRRDEQLAHALRIIRRLRTTLQWHRRRSRDLNLQLQALSEGPLPSRPARRWTEDLAAHEYFEDEDLSSYHPDPQEQE